MAIGNPLSGLAISVRSIFSLSPLISTIATVKPTPAKNPYSTATPRFMEESPNKAHHLRLVDYELRHAEHGAVGRDQREIDAHRAVERGGKLLDYHLDHLHERGDDEDEHDDFEIFQPQRDEEVFVQRIGDEAGERHHEGDGDPHAERAGSALGDAQKRADPQELNDDEVVDENRGDDDQNKLGHYFTSL